MSNGKFDCCETGACCDSFEMSGLDKINAPPWHAPTLESIVGSCNSDITVIEPPVQMPTDMDTETGTATFGNKIFVSSNNINSEEEMNPGDIVQLKSGGPKMTVASALINGGYYCQWFDSADFTKEIISSFGTLHNEWFLKQALIKV